MESTESKPGPCFNSVDSMISPGCSCMGEIAGFVQLRKQKGEFTVTTVTVTTVAREMPEEWMPFLPSNTELHLP